MPTDLILLAADKNIEHGMRGLLGRPQALGIRPLTSKIYVHPQRDPACAQKPHEFLRQFSRDYDRALVVFDHQGCGMEDRIPLDIEANVRQLLAANGWDGRRADAVVIAPELEAWVFSTSPQVETCLAWPVAVPLRQWLEGHGLWRQQDRKPDPKTALEKALANPRRPRSSAIYESLANAVDFAECQDASFNRFKRVLQNWFPPTDN
jgi:hypothetical protein